MSQFQNLLIAQLRDDYRSGRQSPALVLQRLLAQEPDTHNVWITRLSREQVFAYLDVLDPQAIDSLPLYGIPFVIKDNIDLAGVPTTAGCPQFSYTPSVSAGVVQRLIDAGAIPLGKTNLDQFATGLVGVRSPYGACRNSINPDYISGGSSAGSAVAVALGLASFSLGTDTAGSGRVPAGFNNIVGYKPSIGRLSTRGVVPACRSLDCVSIFALTAEDAAAVLGVAEGFDAADPYSRPVTNARFGGLRIGVPQQSQREFFGDDEYARLFQAASVRAGAIGGTLIEVDVSAFLEAARLLYDGPWLAERYAAVGEFLEAHPDALHPITRQIIAAGKAPSAADAFRGVYRLKLLERASAAVWQQVDLLMLPTAATIYSLAAVKADPLRLNARLGYYTNFMNLFDLAGVALPSGFRADGLPFGVTLVGPRAADRALLEVAGMLHRAAGVPLGAMGLGMPDATQQPAQPTALLEGYSLLAVCGAHMDGLPLNGQLRERHGYLVEVARTAARYRLYSLPGGPPRRPGLIRVNADGHEIELEVWALPQESVGSFLAGIPAPLGIGKIELESGRWVSGFICEGCAADDSADITGYGGWRAYLKAATL
jgi:allophanate hydrolase